MDFGDFDVTEIGLCVMSGIIMFISLSLLEFFIFFVPRTPNPEFFQTVIPVVVAGVMFLFGFKMLPIGHGDF